MSEQKNKRLRLWNIVCLLNSGTCTISRTEANQSIPNRSCDLERKRDRTGKW